MKIKWELFLTDVVKVVTFPLWILPALILTVFLWLYIKFLERYEE